MTKCFRTLALVVVLGLIGDAFVAAQSQQSPQEKAAQISVDAARRQREEERRASEQNMAKLKAIYPLTPLTVQVIVSRYQGEKKVSSLPYTLTVNANSVRWGGKPSQLRMGTQIPIPTMAPPKTPDGKPIPGAPVGAGPFSYRDIGTNIDCTATSADNGRYQVNISVDDTSVYAGDNATADTPRANDMPIFRSFRSTNELILKDGQSAQFTAATDRVSGEVVKIDVTLTVLK